jgi:hypothetical protein
MPVYSFPADAIVDSTATGRSLITAADQAAARSAIGIDQSLSTTDSPTFADGTFTGTVTVDTINASGSTLDLQLGGSTAFKANSVFSYYYAGGGNTYILQGSDFLRPQGGAAPFDLGGTSHRWRTVFGEEGSFSGNLVSEAGGSQIVYGSYTDASNYERLRTSYDGSQYVIQTEEAGTGVGRSLVVGAGNTYLGCAYNSTLNLYYGGSRVFRAEVAATYMYYGGAKLLKLTAGVVGTDVTNTVSLGTDAVRWSNFYGVDSDCSGTVKSGDGSVTAPAYSFGSQSTMGIYRAATNQINMIAATGGKGFNLQNTSLSISSTMAFGWRSVPNISQGHSFDTLLARDATGIIAQRNFFNNAAQAYRVYGTWTDASNGEWLQIDHGVTTSNTATISSVANGTGTLRNLALTAPSINVTGELNLDGQTVRGIARFKNIASNWIDIDGSTVGTNVANISSRFSFTLSALSGTLNLTGTSGAALQHSNVTKLATTTTGVTATGDVVTDSTFVINRTWNDAAEVFQAFDANITDTASDANSNLLNLKVSGVQKFRVKKDGTCTATAFVGDGSGLTGLPSGSSTLAGLTDTNVSSPANGQLLIYDSGTSKWDNANLTSTGGTIAITNGAGTINLENAGGAPSDRRLKGDVEILENPLDKVLAMLPVKFRWLEGFEDIHKQTGNDIGFIAQELESVEDVLVGENRGYKTVSYEKVVPLLAGAIKEMYLEIKKLKEEKR